VVVTASRQNMVLIEDIVKELDTEVATGRETRILKLQYASAPELVNVINQTQGQSLKGRTTGILPITVVASQSSNAILVTSTLADYQKIQDLVAILDVAPEEGEGRPYKIIPLPQHIDGQQFAQVLEQKWNQGEWNTTGPQQRQPRLIAVGSVPGTNAIIVTGNRSEFRAVEGMVQDLLAVRPPGVRQVRYISLQNIDPNEVKRLIDEVTKPRQR
jgi:type II secretory pathway component GspD/PulD (secretin)